VIWAPDLAAHITTHLSMVAAALLIALAIAVPLGTLSGHNARVRPAILSIFNVGRVIPSLAVLALAQPFLGVGFKTAVVAITLLAIPPIVINTDLAFRAVPAAAVDAAQGMGMTFRQRLLRVEWPLAMPVIFTGIRTAATELVASATLAAFIGGGGLGEYILSGLQANDQALLLTGAICVALLAIAVELLLALCAHLIGEFS
jgi:osmoprotectant transport system permease protein